MGNEPVFESFLESVSASFQWVEFSQLRRKVPDVNTLSMYYGEDRLQRRGSARVLRE